MHRLHHLLRHRLRLCMVRGRVPMKNIFIACFFVLLTGSVHAAYTVTFNDAPNSCKVLNVNDPSCTTVRLAAQNCLNSLIGGGYTAISCSSDPVKAGSSVSFGGSGWLISNVFGCPTGTHLDSSTNTCVDDITTAIVSCLPSIRTISPCPSGFAPTNAIPAGSGAPDPYLSKFDTMPLQDMIYAIGVCFCGLIGLGIGVKLT